MTEPDFSKPHTKGAHGSDFPSLNGMETFGWESESCLCWVDRIPISNKKPTRKERANGKYGHN